RYLEARVSTVPADPPGVFAAGTSRLASVELLDEQGEPATRYLPGDPITVAVQLELEHPVAFPYVLLSLAGEHGPIAAASMFLDDHRPASIEGLYRFECRFEGLVLTPGHTFTVRFGLYASDGTTILHPKRVIATFVMGGSAADCGFPGDKAQGWILGSAPVLANYSWRLPGEPEKSFAPGSVDSSS
ncbi:MAG: Wzt C-terminal domain, partial [Acidimicrobiaceae bacterium]